MAWYKTGSISAANGAAVVYGAGTAWVDAGVLNAGDIITINGTLYEILSIQSNTQLTLASNYLGATAAGLGYAIMPIGLLPSALAQQVKTTLATANAALAAAVRSDVQNLTAVQQQTARNNIAALGAADVGAGRLVKSVAGGVDVVLTAAEAANQFLEFTGTLTANINVIVPAAVRLYYVVNGTAGAYTLTVKTASGSGELVASGGVAELYCDGANVRSATATNPTLKGLTVTGDVVSIGAGYSFMARPSFNGYAGIAFGYSNGGYGSVGFGYDPKSNTRVNEGGDWASRVFFDSGGLRLQCGGQGVSGAGISWADALRVYSSGRVVLGGSADNGTDLLQLPGSGFIRDGLSPTYTQIVTGDLAANTWTTLFSGGALPTGMYLLRCEVATAAAGGDIYDTTFVGQFYWHGGTTNEGAALEIQAHASGHALNGRAVKFRTKSQAAAAGGVALFQILVDETLTGLDGSASKRINLKLIRIG